MALFTVGSEEKITNSEAIIPRSLLIKSLYGLCPNCSYKSVFIKDICLMDTCPNCSIRLDSERVGDGAAWFAMIITSILVGFGALILEINFSKLDKFELTFSQKRSDWISVILR